jgi:hypothetical protein
MAPQIDEIEAHLLLPTYLLDVEGVGIGVLLDVHDLAHADVQQRQLRELGRRGRCVYVPGRAMYM